MGANSADSPGIYVFHDIEPCYPQYVYRYLYIQSVFRIFIFQYLNTALGCFE